MAYFGYGDLATAERFLDELESYDLNEQEQQSARSVRAAIAASREGTPEQLAELWEAASIWDDSTDVQMQAMSHASKAWAKALEGDFRAAFDHAVHDPDPRGLSTAIVAGLALRDPDVLVEARQFARQGLIHGGRLDRLTEYLVDGGLRALEGNFDAAFVHLTEALELAERVLDPFSVASIQALVSGLLGAEHPVGLEAGLDARRWFREHGLAGWERVLAEFLPADDAAVSETA
jgi:hypothetical protein